MPCSSNFHLFYHHCNIWEVLYLATALNIQLSSPCTTSFPLVPNIFLSMLLTNSKFHRNPCSESRIIRYKLTDRQTETTMLIGKFLQLFVGKAKRTLLCGNKMPTRCNRWFLLQILLVAHHVSGTIMPIIRSSRVLYKWVLHNGARNMLSKQ